MIYFIMVTRVVYLNACVAYIYIYIYIDYILYNNMLYIEDKQRIRKFYVIKGDILKYLFKLSIFVKIFFESEQNC